MNYNWSYVCDWYRISKEVKMWRKTATSHGGSYEMVIDNSQNIHKLRCWNDYN